MFQIHDVLGILVCIVSGLSFRMVLSFVGQKWVRSYHHTLTYMLLPIIAFVITKVISGNIALSLGMIGALSIVRFRNPVKNPLELVIFFALITIGISSGFVVLWSILLTIICLLSFVAVHHLEIYWRKQGKNIFSFSFQEGSPLHLLEIHSSSRIDVLDNADSLIFASYTQEKQSFQYKLGFLKKDELKNMLSEVESKNSDSIIHTQANFLGAV